MLFFKPIGSNPIALNKKPKGIKNMVAKREMSINSMSDLKVMISAEKKIK